MTILFLNIIQKEQKQISRVQQEYSKNNFQDSFIRKDKKNIELESTTIFHKNIQIYKIVYSQNNLNGDLIYDQKIKIDHLQKKNISQQSDDNNKKEVFQSKGIDAANLTFYPKQQSPDQEKKENPQGIKYQQQQGYQDINSDDIFEIKIPKGVDSQADFFSQGPCKQNLQQGQTQTKDNQDNMFMKQYKQQGEQYQQQSYKTQQSYQNDMITFNNQRYLLSERQQLEQQEQITQNQMKFNNLYQKNVSSHSKNYSLQNSNEIHNKFLSAIPNQSNKNSLGISINIFESDSCPQNKYSDRQQQSNQQKTFNQFGGLKKYTHYQQQQPQQPQPQQKNLQSMISGQRLRSNSYYDNQLNDGKVIFKHFNQFEQSYNNRYVQEDLKSVRGTGGCNISADQINIHDTNNYYYENQFKNNYINQTQQSYNKPKQRLLQTNVDMSLNSNRNSIKKLSDLCLPSLKIQTDSNIIDGNSDDKKMSQNSLKVQQNQQQQQNFQIGFDKFNIQHQKNVININKINNQDKNIDNKNGKFIQKCQRSYSINSQPSQNALIPNEQYKIQEINIQNSTKSQIEDIFFNRVKQSSNQDADNQEQMSEQLLETTGRFGPESSNENTNRIEEMVNVNTNKYINKNIRDYNQDNKNNLNILNQIKNKQNYSKRYNQNDQQFNIIPNEEFMPKEEIDISLGDINKYEITPKLKKQSQSSHQPSVVTTDLKEKDPNEQNDFNKSFDINIKYYSINKNNRVVHTYQQKSNTTASKSTNKNNTIQHSNFSEIISSINNGLQNNIPLITTNNMNKVNTQQNESPNQGTLLINYNFPFAESNQNDRSKHNQQQQQQPSQVSQNNNFYTKQKKVSSAISCKRNDEFYNQQVVNIYDTDQKPQRARSSNNKFPREIFTPNVQKAKRLYNQSRQNTNQSKDDNEFIS